MVWVGPEETWTYTLSLSTQGTPLGGSPEPYLNRPPLFPLHPTRVENSHLIQSCRRREKGIMGVDSGMVLVPDSTS